MDRSGRDLAAGQQDVVFVYATVVDAAGTEVPDVAPAVRFAVAGPATLVGDNPVRAEAGVAAALVQAGRAAGTVQVTATAEGLAPAVLSLKIR